MAGTSPAMTVLGFGTPLDVSPPSTSCKDNFDNFRAEKIRQWPNPHLPAYALPIEFFLFFYAFVPLQLASKQDLKSSGLGANRQLAWRYRTFSVPDFQTLILPILRLASDGLQHTVAETVEHLAREFHSERH